MKYAQLAHVGQTLISGDIENYLSTKRKYHAIILYSYTNVVKMLQYNFQFYLGMRVLDSGWIGILRFGEVAAALWCLCDILVGLAYMVRGGGCFICAWALCSLSSVYFLSNFNTRCYALIRADTLPEI